MNHLVITGDILRNKELSPREKMVLAMVLDFGRGNEVSLSNEFVAESLGFSPSRASEIFKSLKQKGYIDISYNYVRDSNGRMTKGIAQRNVMVVREKINN